MECEYTFVERDYGVPLQNWEIERQRDFGFELTDVPKDSVLRGERKNDKVSSRWFFKRPRKP